MPLDERALGGNAPQEIGQAVGEGKVRGRVRSFPARWCEQVPDGGRQIQALVAHQHLQGERQRADERPEALDDGFLLVLRFERKVDGRDLQHRAVAASGG